MKNLILAVCGLCFIQFMYGQSSVAVLILDKNNVGVKQEDVKNIMVKICSGDTMTSIYSEQVNNPKVEGGIANINLGKSYSDSLTKYLNTFPKEKKPKAGSYLVGKIKVTLKDGKTMDIIEDLVLSTPEPVVKIFEDNLAMMVPDNLYLLNNKEKTIMDLKSNSFFLGSTNDNMGIRIRTEFENYQVIRPKSEIRAKETINQ